MKYVYMLKWTVQESHVSSCACRGRGGEAWGF